MFHHRFIVVAGYRRLFAHITFAVTLKISTVLHIFYFFWYPTHTIVPLLEGSFLNLKTDAAQEPSQFESEAFGNLLFPHLVMGDVASFHFRDFRQL